VTGALFRTMVAEPANHPVDGLVVGDHRTAIDHGKIGDRSKRGNVRHDFRKARKRLIGDASPELGGDLRLPVGRIDAGVAEEAVHTIEARPPDAVLLNGTLHGKPVDEIAAALTRLRVPFLFATGYARESLPQAFRKVALLSKPFSKTQLLEAAAGLVERRADGFDDVRCWTDACVSWAEGSARGSADAARGTRTGRRPGGSGGARWSPGGRIRRSTGR